MMRHTLRMIARAGGNDTALCLLGRERGDLVQRSAFLEAARHLQILELQEDALTALARERLRTRAGCPVDRTVEALAGCLDVSEREVLCCCRAHCLYGSRVAEEASAAEVRLQLLAVPLQPQVNQPVDELRIGEPTGAPQLWVHADRGKARHRV